jgi:malic enzyme
MQMRGVPAGSDRCNFVTVKACLFKKFAGIDVFDIEVAEADPDKESHGWRRPRVR